MPGQVAVSRNWQILTTLVMTVVVGTTALGALSFIPEIWFFDQLSQFRLIYMLILAVCVLILAGLRSYQALAIGLILLIVTTIPVAAMYIPSRRSVADLSARPKDICISVLNFNSEFQHNDDYKSFDEIVRTREPDVVAIVEINQKWVDALAVTMKPYPFRKFVNEGAGLALFSKYPIVKNRIASFGKSHHPRIFAELRVKDRLINVIVAHPTTPKSLSGFAERNSEIDLLANEIGAITGPKIFIGDLNCGPWSSQFHKLLKAGLIDTQQGFGPQPSWPARDGRVSKFLPIPPLIPIDHVLVSWEFSVDFRRAGPAIGSDHLPVFVKLRLNVEDAK